MDGRRTYSNQPRGQDQRINHMNYIPTTAIQPQPRGVLLQPPRYIQQQQPPGVYYDTDPGLYPYQQSYGAAVSQRLPWEQYPGTVWHHPYQPAAHMMPMNTAIAAGANAGMPPAMMSGNSGMLATTRPHMHSSNVHHHHATMVHPPVTSMATKQSKAIKIVNPETMREVDTSKLKKMPPTSAYSITNPISEVQQQSKQTVEEMIIEPIEKTNSIQQIDKQLLEIQNVLQKREDTMDTLKAVDDLDSPVVSVVAVTADQLQYYEDISDGEFEVTDDDDVGKGIPAAGADNDTGDLPDEKADELIDEELEEDELEEGEQEDREIDSEDDDRSKIYGRDFLLSLEFLEECKQWPANLINAEYIRTELPRQSEIRFDPGYYDMPSGRKKMSYQSSKRKIALPSKLWTQHDLEQKYYTIDIPLPENIEAEILQSVVVLLVSANINETLAICSYLQPLDGHEYVYKFEQDEQQAIYYIGKCGACSAAFREASHSSEAHGSVTTISTPADQCFPNLSAIISVGVACGIKGKVQMCDVLVSSQIVHYDKTSDTHYSLTEKPITVVSPWLKKLFFKPTNWPDDIIKVRLIESGMPLPNVMSGMILSGPYHVDELSMNNFVRTFANEAIGIEMLRAHLFAINTTNIVIVKAVCDFGNGEDNEVYQPTAALLAADLVHTCLSDHQAFEELKGKIILRQMLQQAKNEGLTINVRHAKVVFCGAAKAGKTSFSRFLRNEEHVADYKSTATGDSKQVLISDKVNVVGTSWISLDSKLETQQITNRLIAKLQKQKHDKSPIHSESSTPGRKDPGNDEQPHYKTGTEVNNNNLESKENVQEIQSLDLTSNSQTESPDYSEQTNKQIFAQEQMMMCIDIVKAPASELESIPETWDLFTLLDTGGQPEFINMLPAINSSTAITFVVMNISDGKDCLKNTVVGQYVHEGYNYSKCTLKYTNMHLLKCLLSSVKVAAMKEDCFNPEIVKQVTKDKHPKPVVYIIGTCVDLLKKKFGETYNEEVDRINEEVKKLINVIKDKGVLKFQCKLYNENCVHVIPVDNTISREKDIKCEISETIENIRKHCNTILRSKPQYEIPIAWFILELELRNNDKVCISLTKVKDICDRIMPPHRQIKLEEIREILKFYHSFGMLLYFSEVDGMNNYVITDPQWLFLNLSKIIMCKFVNNANDIYDADVIEEMDKGICSLELLKRLDLNLQGIELESFVNLLIHLKVIAPVMAENVYLMPTILPPCNDRYIFTERECGEPAAYTFDGQCICQEVKPLLIEFTSGTIPRGLFGFLVVQLLQDNPNTYELYGKNDHNILRRCSDLLCFYVKPCLYVSLRDKIFYLELQVRVIGKEPSYHYKAQTIITDSLRKVCDEFSWQFNDCHYGFLCCEHREDLQDDHLTLLPTNPPYRDKIPKHATCCKQKPTNLSNVHTIWFEDPELQKNSALYRRKVKVRSENATATSLTAGVQNKIFNKKPKMRDLNHFVIPRIAAKWEDVAYALHYDTPAIDIIKKNHIGDVTGCCKELFEKWLGIRNGKKPKIWKTLITTLEEIDELTSVTQRIIDKLIQMDSN